MSENLTGEITVASGITGASGVLGLMGSFDGDEDLSSEHAVSPNAAEMHNAERKAFVV